MNTGHSPLPWKVVLHGGKANLRVSIADAQGLFVCDRVGKLDIAELIVRAVNSHAKLLAAAKTMRAGEKAAQNRLDTAIAKA